MSFNAICKNKILAKISEFTVIKHMGLESFQVHGLSPSLLQNQYKKV